MLKKLLLLAWVVLLPSYSYSESIAPYFGNTPNAAANGHTWDMGVVLPAPPGLSINGVLYNYTIQKNTEDSVTVNVQNENATGTGYIFRETDEWKPGSLGGTEINKVIGVGSVHRSLWGDGSIDVQGNGSVTDANVIYTYTVDPCYDPQFDPNCPGYKVPVPVMPEPDYAEVDVSTIYDATQEEYAELKEACKEGDTSAECKALLEEKEEEDEDKKKKDEEEEEKDRKMRLEDSLAEADNSALFAEALAAAQILEQVNAATNVTSYYNRTIPGGTYSESVVLVDKQLPENRRGLRNGLAQQLLHNKMIESQYNR